MPKDALSWARSISDNILHLGGLVAQRERDPYINNYVCTSIKGYTTWFCLLKGVLSAAAAAKLLYLLLLGFIISLSCKGGPTYQAGVALTHSTTLPIIYNISGQLVVAAAEACGVAVKMMSDATHE